MKNIFFRLFVVAMILPNLVFAQASVIPISPMQRAISGVMQTKFTQRGFASNDPRWSATLESAGVQIVGAAASAAVVTAAGITAPAWVTVGATVALGMLFATGINLAVDGVKWLFNSDGSVTYSSNVSISLPSGKCYGGGVQNSGCYGSIIDAAFNNGGPKPGIVTGSDQYGDYIYTTYYVIGAVPGVQYYNVKRCRNGVCRYDYAMDTDRLVPNDAQAGILVGIKNGTPQAVQYADPVRTDTVTLSPTQAVSTLSDADKSKAVNPAILAAIADQAWKQAASKPGYSGFPYDPSNPITQADVLSWQAAHTSMMPTVADLVAPQSMPVGSSVSPFTLPNSAATPAVDSSTTPPVTTPPSGIDWAIPATTGVVPKQIVPVTYTPTVFASASGCPAPISFSMFDKQYAIEYQPACDLMATVAPIFLAIGAAGAALIFASALKS